MTDRPRVLRIGPSDGPLDAALSAAADVETAPGDAAEVVRRLQAGGFTAVVASSDVVSTLLEHFRRHELIVSHIRTGLAVLDPSGAVLWANLSFRQLSGSDPTGKPLLAALGATLAAVEVVSAAKDRPELAPPSVSRLADPFAPARQGLTALLRVHRLGATEKPFLDIDVRPVVTVGGTVTALITLVRDVTSQVVQQQKLDALHAAGRQLAGLDTNQLTDMDVAARVELLKSNLRRTIRDLLHYDTIEVRLLDRDSSELKPLLADGMLPEAANRKLYARPTGNGVTGFVAATGQSYLCPDAENDPHYLAGSAGARSSMTVPLMFEDAVIGTLNVESPRTNAFGPNDLQFTELFSKEIAAALHTLDLLSAQQVCTAGQMSETLNKEIAIPLDDVLAGVSSLLAGVSSDPEATARLRRVLAAARQVKEKIAQVGRDMSPAPEGEGARPLLGKRVLVIESDERFRRAAHLLLSRLGAAVETAGTGADGLAMATDADYDAIFQEVKPPDMGGYDCYSRLRAARPRAAVSLTTGFGYDVAHSIVKARADGMRHVLFKPFRQDQVVRAVLEGDRPPAPGPADEVVGVL